MGQNLARVALLEGFTLKNLRSCPFATHSDMLGYVDTKKVHFCGPIGRVHTGTIQRHGWIEQVLLEGPSVSSFGDS